MSNNYFDPEYFVKSYFGGIESEVSVMPATNFPLVFNNLFPTTVVASYSPGSGKLYVASTAGLSASSGQWFRISTFRGYTPLSILKVTGIGSDSGGPFLTIAGLAPNEGDWNTDVALIKGDFVSMKITEGMFVELYKAINALESSLAPKTRTSTIMATGVADPSQSATSLITVS